MRIQKTKSPTLIALMLLAIGVFIFVLAAPALAAEPPIVETLSVDEVWLTGDVLHITVTDINSGESKTLELNLSDYAKPGDEYVSVQATDSAGRKSNIIQFRNPYYVPAADNGDSGESPAPDGDSPDGNNPNASENPAGDGNQTSNGRPFTPDGTGTVVDNATETDGKEFFTVETVDGNVFYLIVDRQRNAENVYFLNAVTEEDLMSLAEQSGGNPASPTTPAPEPPVVSPTPEPPTEPMPPAPPADKSSGNAGTIALVIGAMVIVGGVGYYFKIVRPKKEAADDYDNSYYEPDGDEELPLDGEHDNYESEVDRE